MWTLSALTSIQRDLTCEVRACSLAGGHTPLNANLVARISNNIEMSEVQSSECAFTTASASRLNPKLDGAEPALGNSPLQAPTWLLPAALDLVAFMAIWTASQGTVRGSFASLFR